MKKISLLILVLLVLSCSSSDDGDAVLENAGNLLSARINGDRFLALDESVAAAVGQSQDFFVIILGGSSLNIFNGTAAAAEVITISLVSFNTSDFRVGGSWDSNTIADDDSIVAGYASGTANTVLEESLMASSEAEGGGVSFRITSLDENAQLISGEFSFTAIAENGDVIRVTEGSYTNVPYEIN